MSPPKTMQFHIPQTRLLHTPCKSFHFIFCIPFFYFPSILTAIPYIPFFLHFFFWQTLPLALLPSPRSQQTNCRIPPSHNWGQHHGRLGRSESKRGEAGRIIGGRHILKRLFLFHVEEIRIMRGKRKKNLIIACDSTHCFYAHFSFHSPHSPNLLPSSRPSFLQGV